jgi:hypothetical protein
VPNEKNFRNYRFFCGRFYKFNWGLGICQAEAKGGYLATATSSAENEFIFGLIDSPQFWFMDTADNNEGPWLGGYWEGGSWKWVTGEVWSWTNWDNWEPNNIGVETRLNFFSNDASASNQIRESYWNNVGPTSEMKGYIVEFDRNPVPIPGAVWLLGSGLIGLIGLRRRFT